MAQRGLCNLAREKMLQDRGTLPEQEGDVIREFKAMHEDNFLRSWLREDEKDKKERHMEVDREMKEEMGEKRVSEEEKEEIVMVIVKRRCVNPVSTKTFDIFCQGEDSESCGNSWSDLWDESGGLSHCDSGTWTVLPVVYWCACVLLLRRG